jgi:hypothetical protein
MQYKNSAEQYSAPVVEFDAPVLVGSAGVVACGHDEAAYIARKHGRQAMRASLSRFVKQGKCTVAARGADDS